MAGNLTAFQLGPGSIVSIETNQGQVLALVGNPNVQSFAAATSAIVIPPSASGADASQSLNFSFLLAGAAGPASLIVVDGLLPGRAQWLQFLFTQGLNPKNVKIVYNTPTVLQVPALVPGGTDGTLILTPTAAARDIVSAYWDGAVLYALVAGKDFR